MKKITSIDLFGVEMRISLSKTLKIGIIDECKLYSKLTLTVTNL